MPYPPSSEPTSSAASPVTASIVPPIPTPSYGTFGNFSVLSQAPIAAAPATCLSLIRDTTSWCKWNTFCPACTISPKSPPAPECTDINVPTGNPGWLELGSEITFDVFMNGDGLVEGRKRSRVQGGVVTRLEKIDEVTEGKKGYRIAWKGVGWAHWQLHSERVMEFVETEVNGALGTELTCWETFGGVLGVAVKATVGSTLVERFGDYNRDVKSFLERERGKVSDGDV